MFVLDTNTLIYYFKRMGRVADNLLTTPPMEIGIPAVVLFELQTGILKSTNPQKRAEQLHALTKWANVLPFSVAEAECAARIRVRLEQQGQPIGQYDVLIAATALARNAVLVTHNTREFSRIAGLQVLDWFV